MTLSSTKSISATKNLIALTQISNGDDDLGNAEQKSEEVKGEFTEDLISKKRDGSKTYERDVPKKGLCFQLDE